MTFIDFESALARRNSWSLAVLLGLVVAIGCYHWQFRTVPVYAAETTVQFEASPAAAPGAAPAIKTMRQLFDSNQLRSQVAASLTPAERRVVLRAALRRLRGQPPPSLASSLGSIDSESVGDSSRIRVKVTHEDPEAAALIANRYVEQVQALFSHEPDFAGAPSPAAAMSFHRLDVATPNYSPRNRPLFRTKRSGLGLAFGFGLAAAAALSLVIALRNAGEMRSA